MKIRKTRKVSGKIMGVIIENYILKSRYFMTG